MDPPDLSDDWESQPKEELEMKRRQLLLFAASITDESKQGSKQQLITLTKPLEDLQDAIIGLDQAITP